MADFKQQTFGSHISRGFNRELEDLRNAVLVMGGEIELQLQYTLQALKENNAKLAEKVILNDDSINSLEIQIEEECLRLLATRNPTATDLRLVVTVSKLITELERIGDEIERVARLTTLSSESSDGTIQNGILQLGVVIQSMLKDSFNAFARGDAQIALEIYEREQQINNQSIRLTQKIQELLRDDSQHIPYWLEVYRVIRSLERIGDRCKNICEFIIYLADGKLEKHGKIKKLQKRIQALTTLPSQN